MSRRVRSDYELAIYNLSTDFLFCRGVNHPWKLQTAWTVRGGWEIFYFCPSCESKRFEQLDRNGALIKRRYDYSPGFILNGYGRQRSGSRDYVRREMFGRIAQPKPRGED